MKLTYEPTVWMSMSERDSVDTAQRAPQSGPEIQDINRSEGGYVTIDNGDSRSYFRVDNLAAYFPMKSIQVVITTETNGDVARTLDLEYEDFDASAFNLPTLHAIAEDSSGNQYGAQFVWTNIPTDDDENDGNRIRRLNISNSSGVSITAFVLITYVDTD